MERCRTPRLGGGFSLVSIAAAWVPAAGSRVSGAFDAVVWRGNGEVKEGWWWMLGSRTGFGGGGLGFFWCRLGTAELALGGHAGGMPVSGSTVDQGGRWALSWGVSCSLDMHRLAPIAAQGGH